MKNFLFLGIIAFILIANVFIALAYNRAYDAKLDSWALANREAGMLHYKKQILLECMSKGDTLINFAAVDSAYVKELHIQ